MLDASSPENCCSLGQLCAMVLSPQIVIVGDHASSQATFSMDSWQVLEVVAVTDQLRGFGSLLQYHYGTMAVTILTVDS